MSEPDISQLPGSWDAVAENYERVFAPVSAQYAEHALRLAGLQAQQRVLDVAAGSGALSLTAAKYGARVVASDFSPGMLLRLRARIAAEGLSNISTVVTDGQALNFPDGTFDAVFSTFGLMFFPDRIRGFGEMRRVLKTGGRAGVVAWSRMERVTPYAYLLRALQTAVSGFAIPEAPLYWQQLQDPVLFESEMTRAGFAEVSIYPVTELWRLPSARWLWEHLRGFTPALDQILESLHADELEAVGNAYVAAIQADFGENAVALPTEGLVGIGIK